MTSFFKLFEAFSDGIPPAAGSAAVDEWFPLAFAGSRLHLWRPGDPVQQSGTRVLLGVATWSGYDMRLLDVVEKAVADRPAASPTVDVFNAADCRRPGAFRKYIARLRTVFQLPVAGIWREGELDWSGQGCEAREQVARMFGSSSPEIVTYVQTWLAKRSAASSDGSGRSRH